MRQLCRYLSFLFFSVSLFVGLFSFTKISITYAQETTAHRDDIGPEVAGAGYTQDAQKHVNDAVLVPQQYKGIVQIANGLDEAPYNPTPQSPKIAIRIVGFDFAAPASKFSDYGKALCANKSIFPENTIVIVGNELNNLDLEYKGTSDLASAAKQYATQFNALADAIHTDPNCAGYFRVAPAPPDEYNGVWDPVPWINSFKNNGGCSGADVLVANVFDLGGSRVGLPALDVWKFLETNMCPGKRVVHFGGLGVNPNSQPPPSIQSQLDFLNKFKLPAGVETATTLLLDPCKDSNTTKSDWLFYVYGKAYDKDGNEVTEDCSKRKKPIFVYPGIEDMKTTAEKNAMAASYMLTCGSKVTLQGDILNESRVDDNLPGYDSFVDGHCSPDQVACRVMNVFGNVLIDNTKTVIPLFRLENATVPNPEEPTRRLDDLEGLFSSSYTKQEINKAADLISPLANGVTRKLVDQRTQCQNTMTYLSSIKKLCDDEKDRSNIKINEVGTTRSSKLPPSSNTSASPSPQQDAPVEGECALYLPISGAKQQVDSYRKVLENVPQSAKACTPEWLEEVPKKNKDWYQAFTSIEVTTPKGFKPAYLVRYMDRPEVQPSSFTSKATWLTPSTLETNPSEITNMTINDRIQITKVYVPAGFAEENAINVPGKKSFFPTYDGGFTQTAKSILPKETIERIQNLTQEEVNSIAPKIANQSYNSPNPDKKFVQCTKCSQIPADDYRGIIVRRINAQFSTQINLGGTLGTPFAGCTYEDYVGETAKERVQSINPDGNPDPVQPRQQTAVAHLNVKGTSSDPQTVRTFLLLPEEYRTVNNYELAFLHTFIAEENKDNPEFHFISRRSERKSPKNPYRYLQLSNSGFDISSPSKKADVPIGVEVAHPTEPDPNNPTATTAPASDGPLVYLEGRITGTKSVGEFNPDPQLPGGMLARGLWEIMCNVLRPHDGVETIQYPGFEAFLKEGVSACTKGAKPSTSPSPGAGGICSGTTAVPSHSSGDWAPLKAIVTQAAAGSSIPAKYLWGVFNIEGAATLNAYAAGETTAVCKANSVGAVGPMQVLVGACGGPFGNWEKYSVEAGVAGSSPCDLLSALKVAVKMLEANYQSQSQTNCFPNYPNASAEEKKWMNAAGAYYGSCKLLTGVSGCTRKDGTALTYGECAIELYAPGF